jgi:hypothetical protein
MPPPLMTPERQDAAGRCDTLCLATPTPPNIFTDGRMPLFSWTDRLFLHAFILFTPPPRYRLSFCSFAFAMTPASLAISPPRFFFFFAMAFTPLALLSHADSFFSPPLITNGCRYRFADAALRRSMFLLYAASDAISRERLLFRCRRGLTPLLFYAAPLDAAYFLHDAEFLHFAAVERHIITFSPVAIPHATDYFSADFAEYFTPR